MQGALHGTRALVFMVLGLLLVLSGCRVPPRTATTSAPTPRPTALRTLQAVVAQRTPTPVPTAVPKALTLARSTTASVDMIEHSFIPDIITITVGTTLTWKNKGYQAHDATAIDRSWGGMMVNNGNSWPYTFQSEGVYDYYCTVHPGGMAGRVIVVGR